MMYVVAIGGHKKQKKEKYENLLHLFNDSQMCCNVEWASAWPWHSYSLQNSCMLPTSEVHSSNLAIVIF